MSKCLLLLCVIPAVSCTIFASSLISTCFFLGATYVIFLILILGNGFEFFGVVFMMVYASGIMILLVYLCAIYEINVFSSTYSNGSLTALKKKQWKKLHAFTEWGILLQLLSMLIGFVVVYYLIYPLLYYFDGLFFNPIAEHSYICGVTVEFFDLNADVMDTAGLLTEVQNLENRLSLHKFNGSGLVYRTGILLTTVYAVPFVFVISLFFVVLLGVSATHKRYPNKFILISQ